MGCRVLSGKFIAAMDADTMYALRSHFPRNQFGNHFVALSDVVSN